MQAKQTSVTLNRRNDYELTSDRQCFRARPNRITRKELVLDGECRNRRTHLSTIMLPNVVTHPIAPEDGRAQQTLDVLVEPAPSCCPRTAALERVRSQGRPYRPVVPGSGHEQYMTNAAYLQGRGRRIYDATYAYPLEPQSITQDTHRYYRQNNTGVGRRELVPIAAATGAHVRYLWTDGTSHDLVLPTDTPADYTQVAQWIRNGFYGNGHWGDHQSPLNLGYHLSSGCIELQFAPTLQAWSFTLDPAFALWLGFDTRTNFSVASSATIQVVLAGTPRRVLGPYYHLVAQRFSNARFSSDSAERSQQSVVAMRRWRVLRKAEDQFEEDADNLPLHPALMRSMAQSCQGLSKECWYAKQLTGGVA